MRCWGGEEEKSSLEVIARELDEEVLGGHVQGDEGRGDGRVGPGLRGAQ